jgi:hypothetical protein
MLFGQSVEESRLGGVTEVSWTVEERRFRGCVGLAWEAGPQAPCIDLEFHPFPF